MKDLDLTTSTFSVATRIRETVARCVQHSDPEMRSTGRKVLEAIEHPYFDQTEGCGLTSLLTHTVERITQAADALSFIDSTVDKLTEFLQNHDFDSSRRDGQIKTDAVREDIVRLGSTVQKLRRGLEFEGMELTESQLQELSFVVLQARRTQLMTSQAILKHFRDVIRRSRSLEPSGNKPTNSQ